MVRPCLIHVTFENSKSIFSRPKYLSTFLNEATILCNSSRASCHVTRSAYRMSFYKNKYLLFDNARTHQNLRGAPTVGLRKYRITNPKLKMFAPWEIRMPFWPPFGPMPREKPSNSQARSVNDLQDPGIWRFLQKKIVRRK